jgi:hypothetical protein
MGDDYNTCLLNKQMLKMTFLLFSFNTVGLFHIPHHKYAINANITQ